MKRTYTIVTISDSDIKMEHCNHFVTLQNRLLTLGVKPHSEAHLAGRLVHQDLSGNEVLVFASAPMGFETVHKLRPACFIQTENEPEQLDMLK